MMNYQGQNISRPPDLNFFNPEGKLIVYFYLFD